MYFHAYTPLARKPATTLRDMAVQHINHGKAIPVESDRERPSAHHRANTFSVGVLSGPHIDSAICPSSEGSYSPPSLPARGSCLSVILPRPETITRLENNHDNASNVDSDNGNNFDLPHPDKLSSLIWNNSEGESSEASVALQSVDNRSGLNERSSTKSKVRVMGVSYENHPGDTEDDQNDGKHLSHGSKGGLSDILGPKGLVASCQLVGESHTTFSECSSPQSVTETTVCSPSRIFRSKYQNRKQPASTILEYVQIAADRGSRTRARARAEASYLFSSRQRARPYSNAEGELLRELMHRKLQWEQIEEEFSQRFAGRNLKSLQGRWSRKLKFEARPATSSKPRNK
jgi:hypothetical protein